MFVAVALFGIATIVFGLSTWFPLSLLALFVLGASDMVSVNIRGSLIQLSTPDYYARPGLGVSSMLFIGASNELGEFESGTTAALMGTVPAVVAGGIGTLLVVAAVDEAVSAALPREQVQRRDDSGLGFLMVAPRCCAVASNPSLHASVR